MRFANERIGYGGSSIEEKKDRDKRRRESCLPVEEDGDVREGDVIGDMLLKIKEKSGESSLRDAVRFSDVDNVLHLLISFGRTTIPSNQGTRTMVKP